MISAEERRARLRRMRQDFKRRGLCLTCGSRPARIERSTCEVCAEKNSAHEKRRAERLREGRPARRRGGPGRPVKRSPSHTAECLRCKAPAAPGETVCTVHLKTLAELDAEGWVTPDDDEERAR